MTGVFSTRRLVKACQEIGLQAYQNLYTNKWIEERPCTIAFRWGTDKPYKHRSELQINTPEAIQIINNKPLCRLLLQDAGVNCPKTYIKDPPKNTKLVIRPNYHQRGQDFKITENCIKLPMNYYASEFIEIDTEYRAHYLMGNVFAFYQKAQHGNQQYNERWKLLAPPKAIKQLMCTACESLSIDHTAADIYLDKNGNFGIFELNSFPTIKTRILADLYARELQKIYERHINGT